MKDKVATTRIYRMWTVPGLNDPDAVNLDVATSVLGGLASSRLDNEMVQKQQLAVAVSAGLQESAKVGLVEVYADRLEEGLAGKESVRMGKLRLAWVQ